MKIQPGGPSAERKSDCTPGNAGPPLEPQPARRVADCGGGLVKALARTRMTPNQVTLARILVAFAAVALFSFGGDALAVDLTAVVLTIVAIALDGVDGYLARSRGLQTPFGAKFDILGDRVAENLFFTCFAASGLISLWVPVVFFGRGALTDFLGGLASQRGDHCDQNWMRKTWWGRSLVASRTSRASYALLKCICFSYLGLLLSIRRMPEAQVAEWFGETNACWPLAVAKAITFATVVFCIARAIPMVWEARRYLTARSRARKAVPMVASR
jgi:CDP-diacylglycerol---glycerol-3-phosphate 3-phosphatidyltransferase